MGKKIRMLFVWKAFFGGLKPFLLNGGALGYRPDLFGDESPNPFLASLRMKEAVLFSFDCEAIKYGRSRELSSLVGYGATPHRSPFPVPRALLRKLALVERRVEAAFRQQRFVVALLDDVAVLHHQNYVRALNGG